MGDRLLASVIELEKLLQEEVRQEEARVAAWREREEAALAAGLETARRELAVWRDAQAAAGRRDAESAGAALRAAAAERCARLAALPEDFLERVLQPQLSSLLPEVGDDHPHGQG